jgi:nicotinate (nicotinamide) nucleotide adenylyltransferase
VELSLPTMLFFGGAFDPPHNAHEDVLKKCGKVFSSAKLRIFIDQQPPPLGGQQKKPTPFKFREAMVELLIDEIAGQHDVGKIDLKVVSEPKSETPQYAVDRLQKLDLTEERAAWVLGDDQWLVFDKWKSWQKIEELVDFVVFPREERYEKTIEQYKNLFGKWNGETNFAESWLTESKSESGRPKLFLYHEPFSKLSSTGIRSDLRGLKSNVSKQIANYIEKNNLYSPAGGPV